MQVQTQVRHSAPSRSPSPLCPVHVSLRLFETQMLRDVLRDDPWRGEGPLRATAAISERRTPALVTVPIAPIQIREVKNDLKHCRPYIAQFPF